MQNLIKTLNKKHLAVFVALTAAGFVTGGITPMFMAAVGVGAGYIIWQMAAK